MHIHETEAAIKIPIKGFPNLRELFIAGAGYQTLYNITNSAKILERLKLEFYSEQFKNLSKTDKKSLETLLVNLFSQDTLEYVSIWIDRDIEVVRNALTKMILTERCQMRMCISISAKDEHALEYVKVLEKLEDSCDDYIFRFKCIVTKDMIGKISTFDHEPGGELDVVYSNENCKIDGWRGNWTHSCPCLKQF